MSAIARMSATPFIGRVARVCVAVATLSVALPAFSAPTSDDPKPDHRKANAAYQRGLGEEKAGRRDSAIASYTEAIGEDPNFAAPLRARGRDYAAMGEKDKALADFNKAVAARPPDGDNFAARGEFFEANGQPERAVSDLSAAINLKTET